MIRLPDYQISTETQQGLDGYQAVVNAAGSYSEQVKLAKKKFSQWNRPRNAVFKEVRSQLTEMCAGAARCGYCEDSYADQVEHIKPKDLYPEVVFSWLNYLYACGKCNRTKLNHWAIISHSPLQVINIKRDPINPVHPGSGESALIDPRSENPMDFLILDLRTSFYYWPYCDEGTLEWERAIYTIETLEMNRDTLLAAREEAFRSYRSRLREFIEERDDGATQVELNDLVRAVKRMGHPTVWAEMKRQQEMFPSILIKLRSLFQRAPEALSW